MTDSQVLYIKEDFTFTRKSKNNYCISFVIQNNHIILSKIIDFNLVKLIYDLNPDIYENVNIQLINEDEAIIILLMKHLFEDIGLPQRFSFIHIKKTTDDNSIKFTSTCIKDRRPDNMPIDAELMPIQQMNCCCNIINHHKIEFTWDLVFEPTFNIPFIAEKIVSLIIYKIFNRVKQFIENIIM